MTTNADYHADPAISASHLKAITQQSPYHYWSRFLDPKRPPMEPTSCNAAGQPRPLRSAGAR
jgi:hypothetical protein